MPFGIDRATVDRASFFYAMVAFDLDRGTYSSGLREESISISATSGPAFSLDFCAKRRRAYRIS